MRTLCISVVKVSSKMVARERLLQSLPPYAIHPLGLLPKMSNVLTDDAWPTSNFTAVRILSAKNQQHAGK